MSREPKKKPGEIQKSRKKHLQLQARRDLISKLRSGEPTEFWAHYYNGSAKVLVELVEPTSYDYVLCIVNKRLRIMFYTDSGAVADSYRNCFLPKKNILGVVHRFLDYHKKCECGLVLKASNSFKLTPNLQKISKFNSYDYEMNCKCGSIKNVRLSNMINKSVVIKCKCEKCGVLFDYEATEEESLSLEKNDEGLLECYCGPCSKKLFKFGAWNPNHIKD